jgi:hypothetical protein
LELALTDAFRRFAAQDYKRDPGCIAKGALARALVALDCLDAAVYREGIALRQREPVWGGSVDTAADVRASCAMGLAASGDPDALLDLVDLLADPEHRARSGAVRAIGCTQPLAAAAVLRTKALAGDAEPDVVGECFRALLAVAPETSPDFVARWLDAASGADSALAELAALALGEARLDAAVALLRARWEAEPLRRPRHRVLLRAAAMARTAPAFDWLLGLAAEADTTTALWIVEELAPYRSRQRLADDLRERLQARGDPQLLAAFTAHFGAASDGQGMPP